MIQNKLSASRQFETIYHKFPEHTAFTPYRVCPLGAHSDHQLGKITGFAIDKGIHIAYGPKMNGVVEISSLQFPKRAMACFGNSIRKAGRLGRSLVRRHYRAEQLLSASDGSLRRAER